MRLADLKHRAFLLFLGLIGKDVREQNNAVPWSRDVFLLVHAGRAGAARAW